MTKLYLLAAAAVSAATPVLARDAKPADAAPTVAAAAPAATDRAAPREQRYCVDDRVTGSRIAHRTCQTRAEWLRDGFDPLAK